MRSWEYSHEPLCPIRIAGGDHRVDRRRAIEARRHQFPESRARYGRNQESPDRSREQIQTAPGPDAQAPKGPSGHSGATAERQAEPARRAGSYRTGSEETARSEALG